MKLCFSTLGCPALDAAGVNAAARRYGFQGVEIRALEGAHDLTTLDAFSPGNLESTRRTLTAGGLAIVSMDSGVNFSDADAGRRAAQAAAGRAYVDLAEALGAPYVRIFGGETAKFPDRDEATRWIVEGISLLSDYAKRRGVELLLETHDEFSLGSACAGLLEKLRPDAVRILWDVLHPYRWGESFVETWRQVGPAVRHVHLKDSVHFSRDGFDLALMGEGTLPFADAVAVLRAGGYDGYYSFEWEKLWHPEIPGFEVAFPGFVERMRGLRA